MTKVLHDRLPDLNPFTPFDQIDKAPEERQRGITISIAPDAHHPHGVPPAAGRVQGHVDRDLGDHDRLDQPPGELLP